MSYDHNPPPLPPFPTDAGTLDMLDAALNPSPDAKQTSVGDLINLYSELAGSDLNAYIDNVDGILVGRDRQYHVNDILAALITEVRQLRQAAS